MIVACSKHLKPPEECCRRPERTLRQLAAAAWRAFTGPRSTP